MITKITWPTYRGNAFDGVQAIIQHTGFQKDVEYGKSKIFIRSPQTLFALEEERDKYIPHIILFMQKVQNLLVILCSIVRKHFSGRKFTTFTYLQLFIVENLVTI